MSVTEEGEKKGEGREVHTVTVSYVESQLKTNLSTEDDYVSCYRGDSCWNSNTCHTGTLKILN